MNIYGRYIFSDAAIILQMNKINLTKNNKNNSNIIYRRNSIFIDFKVREIMGIDITVSHCCFMDSTVHEIMGIGMTI